uniref:Fungal-type protein kinase domain-containing protein n=1 Tax=Mycena chlorophos TaxID=658473 RepID=A0ABQ0LH59_MYCCL|nr:predicted protein [Mycena chlorophos]
MTLDLPRQPLLDADGQQHWSLILEAEAYFQAREAGQYTDLLVGIRVLGHLLLALWPPGPRQPFGESPYRHLCREVADIRRSAGSNEDCDHELSRAGLLYRDRIFQIFWSDGETIVSQEDPELSVGRTGVEVLTAEDYLQYVHLGSKRLLMPRLRHLRYRVFAAISRTSTTIFNRQFRLLKRVDLTHPLHRRFRDFYQSHLPTLRSRKRLGSTNQPLHTLEHTIPTIFPPHPFQPTPILARTSPRPAEHVRRTPVPAPGGLVRHTGSTPA